MKRAVETCGWLNGQTREKNLAAWEKILNIEEQGFKSLDALSYRYG